MYIKKFPIDKFLKFFQLELSEKTELNEYHKLFESRWLYSFRMSYFKQRMDYLIKHLPQQPCNVLDIGCGYGTNTFLLALNDIDIEGITLYEFFEPIEKRTKYWNTLGDLKNLKFICNDSNIHSFKNKKFDIIIAQDTLHHIEPINKVLNKIANLLSENGKIIVCEENGSNIMHNIRLFMLRGNNRVSFQFDKKLNKDVLVGNENTRSLSKWLNLFKQSNLEVEDNSVEYLRVLPPIPFASYKKISQLEKLFSKIPFLRNHLFHGVNFTAKHQKTN
jgi:2-polyprenyl-3-methyl-5-hydroxy-6-metoxy-1,4-benzoquinol methylase